MGLSFLAPLFFGGIALLAAPFLIHQIRKPEREAIRFSSVLFIPNIQKEVIERRRIQHILLMLLRMLLLALLVLAFARPYWKALAAQAIDEGPALHLVLLDVSYSMGAEGVFDKAKRAAEDVLDGLASNDRAGVAVFARSPRLVAPIASDSDPRAGSIDAARAAIRGAELTFEKTDYISALEFGYLTLAGGLGDEEARSRRFVIHMVTDFQRSGMPKRYTGWKLPGNVELNPVLVESGAPGNLAITDLNVRTYQNDDVRVVGKIKNWTERDIENLEVRLVMDGKTVETSRVALIAGSGTQTSFQLASAGRRPFEGSIELSDDGLEADNVRYFAWSPTRKRPVLVLSDELSGVRWPASRFFVQALPAVEELPWTIESVDRDGFYEAMETAPERPAAVIVADLKSLDARLADALLAYARDGGQILFTLGGAIDAATVNELLFSELGIASEGNRYTRMRESRFDLMSWVDLEHSIFVPFQGTRFNDFSALRFYNHVTLDTADNAESSRVLARFEDDAPAMLEAGIGAGRVIVWPFALRLEWTNLPKNARFVPILFETLAYLTGYTEEVVEHAVGGAIAEARLAMDGAGASVVQLPGEASPREYRADDAAGALSLSAPGFFRTRLPGDSKWLQTSAVNVVAEEGDPTPIGVGEFELKLAAAPLLSERESAVGIVGANVDSQGFVIQTEYGRWFLIALLVFVFVELGYMSAIKT